MLTTITVADGKYTFIRENGLLILMLRNGELWPNGKAMLEHVGAVHALLDEIETLTANLETLKAPK